MSLNNLTIVTSSITSSQEIKELLESFFVDNNPQRPDNENVLISHYKFLYLQKI